MVSGLMLMRVCVLGYASCPFYIYIFSRRSSGVLAFPRSDPQRSRGNIKGEMILTKPFTNDRLTRSTAQIMIEARYEEVDLSLYSMARVVRGLLCNCFSQTD